MFSGTRRRFLGSALGAGVTLGLGSLVAASPAADAQAPTGPLLDLTGMPYRQDDPRWADDLMWDRKLVMRADMELNGRTRAEAAELLHRYPNGNSIGNEGCMLTCMAMAMQLLAPSRRRPWTPAILNRAAHDYYYYTLSGLAMATLYSDLVAEISDGHVQMGLTEEYLPGMPGWKPMTASTAPLVRAYRGLTPAQRSGVVMMIKTGTYDDSVASHFVLLNPNAEQSPDDPNAALLDPAMPKSGHMPWLLTDSAAWITQDTDIRSAWQRDGITPTQIGGAWVYARWDRSTGRSTIGPLVAAWARELGAS